jgi:hypothetical protein
MFLSSPHPNLIVLEVLIIAHPAAFFLEIFGSGEVCVASTPLHGLQEMYVHVINEAASKYAQVFYFEFKLPICPQDFPHRATPYTVIPAELFQSLPNRERRLQSGSNHCEALLASI